MADGNGPECTDDREAGVIRVLIVDDHALVAHALREALGEDDAIEVVGCATDAAEAVRSARALLPDVILLDQHLGPDEGLELVADLHAAADPSPRVVCTTAISGGDIVTRAVEAGCIGFVPKTASLEDLATTVHRAARGEKSFDLVDVNALIDRLQRGPEEELTGRELAVLRLLAGGASTRQIVEELGISSNTVRSHVRGVLTKLGAHSKLEAVTIALKRGLVEMAAP
jgi:two-component system, NarL family, nitrate/nitrite response regulator NarL